MDIPQGVPLFEMSDESVDPSVEELIADQSCVPFLGPMNHQDGVGPNTAAPQSHPLNFANQRGHFRAASGPNSANLVPSSAMAMRTSDDFGQSRANIARSGATPTSLQATCHFCPDGVH